MIIARLNTSVYLSRWSDRTELISLYSSISSHNLESSFLRISDWHTTFRSILPICVSTFFSSRSFILGVGGRRLITGRVCRRCLPVPKDVPRIWGLRISRSDPNVSYRDASKSSASPSVSVKTQFEMSSGIGSSFVAVASPTASEYSIVSAEPPTAPSSTSILSIISLSEFRFVNIVLSDCSAQSPVLLRFRPCWDESPGTSVSMVIGWWTGANSQRKSRDCVLLSGRSDDRALQSFPVVLFAPLMWLSVLADFLTGILRSIILSLSTSSLLAFDPVQLVE